MKTTLAPYPFRIFKFKKLSIIVALIAILISTTHAFAWNATGHRLTALVAYEQLDETDRTNIIGILKKHKRFNSDFMDRMPQKVKDAGEQVQGKWIFLQAAIWPDIARKFSGEEKKKYHHSTWHYINQPLYLSEEDREWFGGNVPANLDKEWKSGMWSKNMNIVQALKKCTVKLNDSQTSKRDRALYLCWLSHLAGDLHQPLHSTALFSQERFKKGDKGGNGIPIKGKKNLHSLWDGILGTSKSINVLSEKVEGYLSDESLLKAGEKAEESLKFEDWMNESYDAAWEYVYSEDILEEVVEKEEDLEEGLDSIELSDDYFEVAERVATERVVQAGFRLGKLVENLISN